MAYIAHGYNDARQANHEIGFDELEDEAAILME